MWIRNTVWIGGVALGGAIALYALAVPSFLASLRPGVPFASPAADPDATRPASRIDGDMTAIFERLEQSGRRGSAGGPAGGPAGPAPTRFDRVEPATTPAAPIVVAPVAESPVAATSPAEAPPVVGSRPAKGMPVSLVPTPRAIAGETPRVMDSRLLAVLDKLGGGAPAIGAAMAETQATSVAAVPASAVLAPGTTAYGTPTALLPTTASLPGTMEPGPMAPAADAAMPAKVVSDIGADRRADDLNAREDRRIRSLENAAGGTN